LACSSRSRLIGRWVSMWFRHGSFSESSDKDVSTDSNHA
jgi:hypothetical protein